MKFRTEPASEAGETDLAAISSLTGAITVECPGCGYGYDVGERKGATSIPAVCTGECPRCGVVVRITRIDEPGNRVRELPAEFHLRAGLTKVARVRDDSIPVGEFSALYLRCHCGARPRVTDAELVVCYGCGVTYTRTGWIVEDCPKRRAGEA